MTIKSGAHIHLMGICGTAMASLAGLLKSLGYKVTGSDQNVYPPMSTQLEELGISIMQGYKKENLTIKPDLVIVGNVITRNHEEAKALLETDIPYTSLPKAMGDYAIANHHSIVISGTHGKTTTTSIMIKVADTCGVKPGFMVGGIPIDYGRSFRVAAGNFFIIEGDEYDTAFFDKVPKFIHYKPKSVILTSIEFDHADIYKDLDDVKKAFRMLIERIPADGLLIACAEDKNVMELAKEANCRVVTYGVKQGDYQIAEREMITGRNHFAVKKTKTENGRISGQKIADVAIRLPGEHNALNAIAVFALARELGWPLANILQGLANFQGVKRRQEVIGTPSGVTLIEDFAHHPTAVKATIEAIREKYSGSRLICLFEPRSATSRRKIFQKDYVAAFLSGDKIIIAKAYDQSKIAEGDRFSTHDLVSDLKVAGKDAQEFLNADAIVDYLHGKLHKGDVVLIMSNGSFDNIYQKLQNLKGTP
ncbi:MAG: UDP-N-acetylmuramate:L-alanyl-gamma-D-glutamyl-meso-diaminopimelate ligase [Bdellovibrionales bacterium RBG_16_40_8]|nr:MAG: UDP-N-acetylmuramate:L-alanyl-gamma-D-glutamyl-meso-diaminopimelate ligase [Bdellovibrionales bacterium RBG_16_40_8]